MLNKITDGDLAGKGVIGLPDVPGLPTEEMQAKFEETAREVIVPKFNGLVNQLASSTAASELGAIDPTTKGAAKVQDALNSLNEKMSNIKVEGYAPERHASVDDKYGAGSNVAYGHVKLSDEVVSNVSDDDGTAATPRAVWLATRDVVRYSAQGAMGYTEDQKAEARRNIGAAKQEELVSVFELATRAGQTAVSAQESVDALGLESVKTVYQSLTEVQKRQARENIGAAAVGGPDKSVLYEAQELDINQKAQARANIGAPAESHSDTTDKYGAASRLTYGHVKIQDVINKNATSGVAASPEGVAGAIESAKKELAPKDHSSSGREYGFGNGTLYGHVKLSDSTYSSSSMTDGVAATPKAVSLVREAADEAKKTARDAQEAAVGSVKYEAQSLSSEQKSQARVNIGAGSEADVNTALEKSAKAATDADAAKVLANTARTEAQDALGDAALAIFTANSAIGNISNLLNTLNEVNDRVTTVKGTAETAQRTATEAAATAENAEKKSDSAIVSANEAKNSAESALVSAGRAESAAGEARNTADEAKAKAEAANITEHKSLAQEQRNAARANISAVSYEADQGLNDFARYNARTNIKAVSYEQAPQTSLTDEEKAQARKNIGAVSAEEIAPVYAVQYVDQVLTDGQKEKARANIGVPPVSHATPDDRYGAANFSKYGHVRLLNNAHSGYADDSGYAVTPYALWKETKDAVSFGSQTLTDAQKTQARANIGAAPVSHVDNSGNYGKATVSLFGHVRLMDGANQTQNTDGGYAATPYALWKETSNRVSVDAQELTEEQKTQARANINAIDEADVKRLVPMPDWNAGEKESGYVKNRTHWKAMEFVEYVPEGTLTFPADGDNGILNGSFRYRKINYDAKFRVTWDGVPYELYGRKTENRVNLGNEAIVGNYADTGEPFRIQISKNEARAYIYTANKISGVEAKHTYRLEMEELVWHKLDPEYLPDTAVLPNWKAEEGEAGHILNRSHWVEFGAEEIEVIPETAVELKEQATGGLAGFISGAEFISGDKYFVYWNGKRYQCVGEAHGKDVDGNPAVYLGNYAKLVGEGDTGEPFALTSIMRGEIVAVQPMDGTTELTLKVTAANKIYHKLPKEYLPDDIGGGATPDWNAAEGEPGHILHRTHWFEQNGVLLEETNAESFTHPSFGKMWMINKAPELKVGETYTVKYNGTSYNCVCQAAPAGLIEDTSAVAMGNFSVVGGANTGEPFAMLISNVYQEVDIIDLTGSASVQVEIRGEVYHKIDPKFLPNTSYVYVAKFLADEGDDQQPFYVSCQFNELAMKLIDPNCVVQAKLLYYYRENDETPIMGIVLSPSVTSVNQNMYCVEFYAIYNGAITTVRVNEDGTFEFTINEIQG